MLESTIILLNGTSSSGKSTLAQVLQKKLDEPFLHMAYDRHVLNFPRHLFENPEMMKNEFYRFVSAYHRSIATFAELGNRVIFDTVFEYPQMLKECVELFSSYPVYFVAVKCDLDELVKREKARGNRKIGLAARQHKTVHNHLPYDIEVNTSEHTPEQCADTIVTAINNRQKPIVFQQAKERMLARQTSQSSETLN